MIKGLFLSLVFYLDENEDKVTEPTKVIAESMSVAHYPCSLYNELRLKIKQSLTCSRVPSPLIKIVMPFDIICYLMEE